MKIGSGIKELTTGTNGAITLVKDGTERNYSMVDDLVLTEINIKEKHATVEFRDARTDDMILLEFEGVTEAFIKPMDTFRQYNTHEDTVELTTVDQILFDPNQVESKEPFTLVGLGWIAAINAKSVQGSITTKAELEELANEGE